jgi:hypothetical protein
MGFGASGLLLQAYGFKDRCVRPGSDNRGSYGRLLYPVRVTAHRPCLERSQNDLMATRPNFG